MKTITRFNQAGVLSQIGVDLLTELFRHFDEDLKAQHLPMPYVMSGEANFFAYLAHVFSSPGDLPLGLVESVRAIEELASPENKAHLEAAFWASPMELYIAPDASPEKTALTIWLNAPYQLNPEAKSPEESPVITMPKNPGLSVLAGIQIGTGQAITKPETDEAESPVPPSTESEIRTPQSDAPPVTQQSSAVPPPVPQALVGKAKSRQPLSQAVISDSGWRRQGKVARLPKEVRDKLNFLLLDGKSYPDIIKALGTDGAGLNDDNISNWKKGGYEEWLTEQKDMEDMHLREEYTLQLVKENGGASLNEATIKMATAQIRKALRSHGEVVVQSAMEDDSQNYIRLVNALARLTAGALTCQDHRVKEDERQANREKVEADPASLSITPETLRKIEELLRLR